jgi:hypothetical protein
MGKSWMSSKVISSKSSKQLIDSEASSCVSAIQGKTLSAWLRKKESGFWSEIGEDFGERLGSRKVRASLPGKNFFGGYIARLACLDESGRKVNEKDLHIGEECVDSCR